ncbi:phosphoribosyltransferase [Candidatus Solincola sp.]|nr:phosphoribosyltransferase [Actinomycetota bacterium]MDI7252248.1 phosphoribosyltransferase [Actinomycetota bacterium]
MPVLFRDREDAGRKLAESYGGPVEDLLVLGIPRGGIPVGYHLARELGGDFDVLVARKLPIPHNPEAGFGAVAPDGSLYLNEEMLRHLHLTQEQVRTIASRVLVEVRRRLKVYRGDRPFPDLKGKNVILTDDGLATGYTMIAAVEMVRKMEPASVNVAVPVSPENTARRIRPLVDYFHCLHVSDRYPFAVADFYLDFHDLTDEEVLRYLQDPYPPGQS